MQSSFSRKQGGYYSLESRNVSLLCPLLHFICTNKHTLYNCFPSFGPIFYFFYFSLIYFLASGQAKVTGNWLLQVHGITYLQTLQSRVCYLTNGLWFINFMVYQTSEKILWQILTYSPPRERSNFADFYLLGHISKRVLKPHTNPSFFRLATTF